MAVWPTVFSFLWVLLAFNLSLSTELETAATSIPQPSSDYFCTRADRFSGKCRWCNREFPSENGFWAPYPPYWQFPGKCSNQAFDAADTKKCLSGRTVYVIGNSIARQSLFSIIQMLGGELTSRQEQKAKCARPHVLWDCAQEAEGVQLRYLFMNYLDGVDYSDRGGFPYFRYKTDAHNESSWVTGKIERPDSTAENRMYYDRPEEIERNMWKIIFPGYCEIEVDQCLKQFFQNSTEHDIVIFTQGLGYAWNTPRPGTAPQHGPHVDYEAWLTGGAAPFAASLAASFKGQVFRVSLAETNSKGHFAHVAPVFERINSKLWELWKPASNDRPWYTIDQWAINKGRHHLYEDYLHFPGTLTYAMLHQVLNELCPGGGKTTWLHPGKDGDLHTVFAQLSFLAQVNRRYIVIHKGTSHNIPNMDTLVGMAVDPLHVVQLSGEDLAMYPEGEPVPPCDTTYNTTGCADNVYYQALHKVVKD